MTDLEDRLRHATAELPSLPDGLDEVRDRGRRRRLRTRATGVMVTLAALALAGSVALERYDDRPVPIVGEPTETAPSPDVSPTHVDDVVAPGDLPWGVVTNGPRGVERWSDGEPEHLASEPVAATVWLADTGVVVQAAPGEPIVRLGPGDGDELVGAREELLLRAGGKGPDGAEVLLVTWARPADELGPEIVLGMVDVLTRELTELGVVGNREDGPDALAIDGDDLVMATCHLQCTLFVTDVASPAEGRRLTDADWRGGVAVAGDIVATVAFDFDPEAGLPRSGRLVLHDRATGDIVAEAPVPGVTTFDVEVSLAPDAAYALVSIGDPAVGTARAYLVEGLPDAPRVRRLSVDGGARFTGAPSRAAPSDHAGLVWPEIGPDAAAAADRPATGEREPWRRDPAAVAEGFLSRAPGWTVQEDAQEAGGGDARVTVRSPAGIEHTVHLRRPAGSDLWWIGSMAPSDPALQGLGVSSRDGVVEASGSAPPGAVSARLVITFPGSMAREATADIGEPVRITTPAQGSAPFRLQLEHLDADGRVLSLHMTWIPAGDFAAG